MRDPKRIDNFLKELGKIWKDKCPDWRFGQLMFNFLSQVNEEPFFWEEDKFLKKLEEFFEKNV